MKVVLFRTWLRPGIDLEEYSRLVLELYEQVQQIPGFISAEDFTGESGERLSVIQFQDEASLAAWRNDADHQLAQSRGRKEFYESYELQVCDLDRQVRFPVATTGSLDN